jgi:hypothetical protein
MTLPYPDLPELALSIRQPWPWGILYARKDVENRDWPTNFRGAFCIHAAQGMTREEYADFIHTCHAVSKQRRFPPGLTAPEFGELPRGGIVGVAELVDCVEQSDSPWFFGHYGFVLRNPRAVPLIPVKGKLGFFNWRKRLPA